MKQITGLKEVADKLTGGKHLVFHASVNESPELGRQLLNMADICEGMTIETFMPGHLPAYAGDTRFSVATVVPGGHLRKAINDGLVSPLRESLFEQSQAYGLGKRQVDILVLQVSPPDEQGMVSLGPSVGIVQQLLAQNPFVIGILNKHVPKTNFSVHVDRLDTVLHLDEPLATYAFGEADPGDQKIASLVLEHLEPGITVEVGMGGTPDAVMAALVELDDLAIHTGLINDAVRPIVEAGRLRCPVTTTMAVGGSDFYQWLNNNNGVDFRPISETHDVDRLAKLPRFHAINAALQVDLAGNVNSERVGSRLVSLPGGLPDFATGAKRSKGGCNIIVLRSTAGRAQKSTIVQSVDHKTLDGGTVDMIITEHGVADLRDLSASARADAITEIAHPDKRSEL